MPCRFGAPSPTPTPTISALPSVAVASGRVANAGQGRRRRGGGPAGPRLDSPADFAAVRSSLRNHHLPVLERIGTGNIARSIALEAVSHHNDLIERPHL